MAHIIIKHIGAIRSVDMELKKVTVLMGPQSSGKSTIAKIICHCQWVEKQCFSNIEHPLDEFQKGTRFYDSLVEYYRMDGYFNNESKIEYEGDFVTIKYNHAKKKVTMTMAGITDTYRYPKLAYIPSERNIVAAIPNLKKYNDSNDLILYFMYDWFTARNTIREQTFDSLLNHKLSYRFDKEDDYISDNGASLLLANASSGVQSLIPLFLVLRYTLASVYDQKRPLSFEQKESSTYLSNLYDHISEMLKENPADVSESQKLLVASGNARPARLVAELKSQLDEWKKALQDRYEYRFTRLFIEEPEQNLFPDTQRNLVYELLEMLQTPVERDNTLLLTTHSPYILFAINNCMMGKLVEPKLPTDVDKRIRAHRGSWISPVKVGIYEISKGGIVPIQDEDGIIEDNYLNKAYKDNTAEYLNLLNYFDDGK